MKIKRATPVLFVESVEPSLAFWRDALGFAVTVSVPDGASFAFVALERDGVEVMVQTFASLAADLPHALDGARASRAHLFVEVDDLAATERALAAFTVTMPRRETFYGSTETGYEAPGGHHVTFAQFPD